MGVGQDTVWRWCREGNLPCLKVGKHWRVRREALEDFLRRSERPAKLVGQLRSFLQVPDNVLAIAQNTDILHRLDAAFFQVGEAQGGLLVKFYGGEEKSEYGLRARLERNGLEAGRLEREGRFLMRPEQDPLGGRGDELGRLIEEAGQGRTVWASFDWVLHVGQDTALEQQDRLTELVDARQLVVKTAVLEDVLRSKRGRKTSRWTKPDPGKGPSKKESKPRWRDHADRRDPEDTRERVGCFVVARASSGPRRTRTAAYDAPGFHQACTYFDTLLA